MTAPQRFAVRSRILHWVTAIGVFSALLIGFAMVNSVGSYAALVAVHMSIGVTILAVTVVRLVNRRIAHPPAWPPTVGRLEGRIVTHSERLMYGLLLTQPLVGWAMVSAAGRPAIAFGVHLPAIAPFNASVYFVLRQTHSVLAYLLVAVIAAHVCAVLLHTLTLRDRMFSRMWFGRSQHAPATTSEGPS
ncbi:cytochrome b [Mycobacterium kyogaense]|uniref:cytochrome b n=1 Tax=Mycobacterium kyogaense TaxID=2212479 RepID=UPI000DABF998|nr:cytochrome b/b6 domain-containing protein [Mycobacterium kyogaense]